MPKRTSLFKVIPWLGGKNSTQDPGMLQPNELARAENLIFAERGSKKKRPGINYNWDGGWYQTTALTLPPASSITTGQYFTISAGGNSTDYYVWYNKASGGGDPAPGGRTAIEVAIGSSDTATQVAAATASAVGAVADFSATSNGVTATITATAAGDTTDSANVDVGSLTVSTTNDGAPNNETIIGSYDFWFGTNSKTQYQVAVTNGKSIYAFDENGSRDGDLFGGTAWSSDVTQASFATINNLCIIAVDGSGNVMKKWNGSGAVADLGGTPPQASIVREHLGRIWCNDKTNLDRLHYSTTHNPEEWLGNGDSAAIDIGTGDGDPDGIQAIFPPFRGQLFVAKRTRLYRVRGNAPENFVVELVSNGIGCVSHNAVAAVDQDDVVFVSERGIHSLVTTDQFGDFEAKFLSKPIQTEFNDDVSRSRLKFAKAAYVPNINSIVFALTNTSVNSDNNNYLYLYNVELAAWYEWPNVECESLHAARDTDKLRFYVGGTETRLGQCLTDSNFDTSTAGSTSSIFFRPQTGRLWLDGNEYTQKALKRFALIYNPTGSQTITVKLKIDNYPEQAIAFNTGAAIDLLGSTFILGSSALGNAAVLSPYTQTIDGVGRGVRVTVEHNSTDEALDIQGFAIEWEPAGDAQEVLEG